MLDSQSDELYLAIMSNVTPSAEFIALAKKVVETDLPQHGLHF